MGETTTIALLTSINGSLKTVVERLAPQNQDGKDEASQKEAAKVSSLHKGGISSDTGAVKASGASKDETVVTTQGMTVKDIISTLAQIPVAVRGILGISNRNMKRFKATMYSLVNTFTYANRRLDKKSIQSVKLLIESIRLMDGVNFEKIFNGFRKIDASKAGKAFVHVMNDIAEGISALHKVKKEDFKKFDAVVKGFGAVVDNITRFIKTITLIAGAAVGMAVAMKVIGGKEILQGFAIIALITAGLGTIAIGLFALSTLLTAKIGMGKGAGGKKNSLAGSPFESISKLMNSCVIVSYAALGLGFLMKGHMGEMLLGLAGIGMVLLGIGAVATLVAAVGNMFGGKVQVDKEGNEHSVLSHILSFMKWSVVLTGAAFALGLLIKLTGFDLIGLGLGAVASVITGIGVLAIAGAFVGSLIIGADKMMDAIVRFAGWGVGLTTACVLLGMVVQKTESLVWIGLGTVAAVISALSAIAILTSLAAGAVKMAETSGAFKSIIAMGAFGAAVAFAAVKIGAEVTKAGGVGNLLAGIGSISAIIVVLSGVAVLANAVSRPVQQSVKSLALIGAMALGATGILYALAKVTPLATEAGWDNLARAVAAIGTIIAGFGVAAAALNQFKAQILQGAIALAAIEGLALGGALILGITADVAKKIADVDSGKPRVLKAVGLMGLIVVEFGLLAAAATYAYPVIVPGAVALAAVEGVALLGVKVLDSLVNLQNKMTVSKITKENITGEKGVLTIMINTVEGFRDFASKSLLASVKAGAASVAMAPMLLFMSKTSDIVDSIVDLTWKIKKTNFKPEEAKKIIQDTFGIFTKETFDIKLNTAELIKMQIRLGRIDKMMEPLLNTVMGVGQMARAFSGGVIVNGSDVQVVPLLGMKRDGTPVYGNPVNLPKIAGAIVDAMSSFSAIMDNRFATMKRKEKRRLKRNFKTLSTIIEPVSQFAEMVSKYTSDDGESIKQITVNEDGTKTERVINLSNVAQAISNAVDKFAEILFSDGKLGKYKKMGRRRTRKGIDAFGGLLGPVMDFINSLSVMDSSKTPGEIVVLEEDGKRRPVNLIDIANSISTSIGTMLDTIYDKLTGAGNKGRKDKLDFFKKNAEGLTAFTSTLSDIAESVSQLNAEKITASTSAFIGFLTELNKQNSPENIKSLTTMAATVKTSTDAVSVGADTVTMSIQKLDDVLVKNSDKRLKELNAMADALEKIAENSRDMEGSLKNLKEILEMIMSADISKVDQVAGRLGNAVDRIASGAKGAGAVQAVPAAGGARMSVSDIAFAIRQALNNLSIRGLRYPVGPSSRADGMWDDAEEMTGVMLSTE